MHLISFIIIVFLLNQINKKETCLYTNNSLIQIEIDPICQLHKNSNQIGFFPKETTAVVCKICK